MEIARLKIFPEKDPANSIVTQLDGSITVKFNPTTYSISKSVTWDSTGGRRYGGNDSKTNAPPTQFGGGGTRQLSLELFFDTTEESNPERRDVRKQTDQIVKLTLIRR